MINTNHKAGFLRTLWIMLVSLIYTGATSIQSIYKGMTKTSSRTWVNEELNRWSQRMLRLLRIECTIVNPHQIEPKLGETTIIMCNHSSLFDIPIGLRAFPHHSIRMLAKKEMANIPLMKHAMIAAEFPFIDRKNRAQAIRDLEKVNELLKSGIVMWIFPEGTRSSDGQVAPLKKGGFITAIQTGAKIIPLGIRGANSILPARTFQFNLHQKAEVHVGEPIDASEYTLENKELLIEKVYQSLRRLVHEI